MSKVNKLDLKKKNQTLMAIKNLSNCTFQHPFYSPITGKLN